MKLLLLSLLILVSLLSSSQAQLGSSEAEIRKTFSNNTFETGFTTEGNKYISTFMVYGTFVYYFDKSNGLCYLCLQLIDNMGYLNAQVEAYNKKYVIVSDTKWKAYLEEGGILNIELSYNSEIKQYVFYYSE